jgi:hypothetical protein
MKEFMSGRLQTPVEEGRPPLSWLFSKGISRVALLESLAHAG